MKLPSYPALRLLLLALLGLGAACASLAWYGMQDTLPGGLTVDNWQPGRIPIAEFERQLEDKREQLLQHTVRLVSKQADVPLQPADWTLEQMGLQLSLLDITNRLQPLQTGSLFQRAAYRWSIRNESWNLPVSFDAAVLHESLKRGFTALYEAQPKDAQRVIGPNDTISYIPESSVMRINEPELIKQLEKTLPSMGALGWSVKAESKRLAEGTADKSKEVPEAASRQAKETLGTVASTTGRAPFLITLAFTKQEPKVSVSMLQSQGIDRKISEFSTKYPLLNGEGRIHNIVSTASSIQDVLLKPGDVFDYAPYIAETESRFGFKEAPVILNGKLVPGIGGGICQVSSTLYNAVLRAGLEIVERRNHSLPVSYVPLGQDATFASGHINFKFRNNTPSYLLIRTYADDRQVTIKLFGRTSPDISYAVESKTLQTLEPPVKYVLNPTLPTGKQQKISTGKPGYVVETYRIKLQNGVEVGRERMSKDTYAAQPTVIATNQGSKVEPNQRQPEAPLIEDGVKGPTFR
ncbi:VanW family protein [Paenibacillus sp. H1-7]|uniref:VanW family protein n=1 Tax=Paenibacillus sp. H1-7 TaxID=2282849 RepID=UPI001EF939AE|nr:VanW family protein [Paenibacillus sp. H1-7]